MVLQVVLVDTAAAVKTVTGHVALAGTTTLPGDSSATDVRLQSRAAGTRVVPLRRKLPMEVVVAFTNLVTGTAQCIFFFMFYYARPNICVSLSMRLLFELTSLPYHSLFFCPPPPRPAGVETSTGNEDPTVTSARHRSQVAGVVLMTGLAEEVAITSATHADLTLIDVTAIVTKEGTATEAITALTATGPTTKLARCILIIFILISLSCFISSHRFAE